MHYFKRVILFAVINIIFVRYANAIGNADNAENTTEILNSLSTSYEYKTGVPKLNLNVLRFYAQLYGEDDLRNKFEHEKNEFQIIDVYKNALIKKRKEISDNIYELEKKINEEKIKNINKPKSSEQVKLENDVDEKKKELDGVDAEIKKIIEVDIKDQIKKTRKKQEPFLPIDIYSGIRISKNNSSIAAINIFNEDFQNPLGGIATAQVYYKIHPTPYSTDTRYLTVKPSLSCSWISITDNEINKSYDVGVARINYLDIHYIFPVFAEDVKTDAGTIKIFCGISEIFYINSSKVKELYQICDKEKPQQGHFTWRVGTEVNLSEYISFSFEYRAPLMNRGLDKSISLSASLARF